MFINRFDLTGKTAIITGGAGLLGMQHAEAILESGGDLVLTDLAMSQLESSIDLLSKTYDVNRMKIYSMDVTSEDSVRAVCESIRSQQRRVDILINNAAINPIVVEEGGLIESSRLENFSLEQWNLEVAVGLTGAFICAKIFGPEMAADGLGGVILNIASDLSVIAPNQSLYKQNGVAAELQPVKPATYSVIKTGLVGLTRYLSTYWVEQGVRCNALSPGGVYSDQGAEFVGRVSELIPLGRMAQREEYRGAIQFLCSSASSYMNGQNVVIDGGRSAW
jgi:NAD(P)-dependent dehydrogenase (short-subunit alcohol dehydrogenase family)